MASENLYVTKLTEVQIQQLKQHLSGQNWEFTPLNHAHWKASSNKTNVSAYNSGKVCVQGKGTKELVQFYIEPEILGEARFGYEEILFESEQKEQLEPHCGIDESGKGDFFGPLVISCAYTDKNSAKTLFKLGVTDSKLIKNDKKILSIAKEIKKVLAGKYATVSLGPESYNRFYLKELNLNSMLGWGHARSLENLLEKVPNCTLAISDQFSKTGSVTKALMEKGKKIQLIERTKAESDIAVAAASIIARAEFVLRLDALGKEVGVQLPKGASTKVIDTGVALVKKHGQDILNKVAKTHFKTTQNILEKL
jgi:ribonuclease HIII